MATFSLGNVASPIAQQLRLAQLSEAQNPDLALQRQIEKAVQLQQLQQQSPEGQLALQLQQAQLNSALQQQAFQQQQQPLLLAQLKAQLDPNTALAKSFNEELIQSSFNPLSGIRRAGVGAPPVGEIEPIINPLTGQETPFVRDLEMRRSNLAKAAGPVKPIEVDGQLVLPDAQGNYRSVFGAPKAAKSPFTQQQVVSLTDPTDVRFVIPDATGKPPEGYEFLKGKEDKPAGNYTKQQLTSVNNLTDRFARDEYVKKAQAAQSAVDIILQGLSQNNSTGDIAAINQFQSGMVDPGATVREGDIVLMRNAAPILARAQNFIPQLLKGGVIPPEMRNEMRKLSVDIYNMRARNADVTVKRFKNNAQNAGIQFEDIGQEFSLLPASAGTVSTPVATPGINSNAPAPVTSGPASAPSPIKINSIRLKP